MLNLVVLSVLFRQKIQFNFCKIPNFVTLVVWYAFVKQTTNLFGLLVKQNMLLYYRFIPQMRPDNNIVTRS